MTETAKQRIFSIAIWLTRIAVGAVFIFSGFAKVDDLWGFVYKINEYLAAWDIRFDNRAVILIFAFALAAAEFTCGVMLSLGVMRRVVPRIMLLMMAFLLPLTVYIAIARPVEDCGCFGDAWVISNTATCIKNIVLTVAIIFLIKYNRSASHPFLPVMQWAVVVLSLIYCAIIAGLGYFVQPLIDFRPYHVGEHILDYDNPLKTLSIFDDENEITDELLTRDSVLILVVSDLDRHGRARSAQSNNLYRVAQRHNTSMCAIVATDDSTAREWAKEVAAEYPVYTAEDTQLKELVRGDAALIYTSADSIRWKRNLYSLPSTYPEGSEYFGEIKPIESTNTLFWLSIFYIASLAVIFALRFTTRKKF